MVETSIERAKFVVLALSVVLALFVELVFFEELAFFAMLMNIQAFMAHKVSCIKKKASAPSICNSEGKIKDMMKFAAIHNPNIFRLSTLFSLTTFHFHRLCRRQQLKIMVPIDTAHHTIRVSHDSCGNALFNANSMTECPLPRCSKSIILLIAETMKNTHAQLNMAEPSIERAKFVVLALFVEFAFFEVPLLFLFPLLLSESTVVASLSSFLFCFSSFPFTSSIASSMAAIISSIVW